MTRVDIFTGIILFILGIAIVATGRALHGPGVPVALSPALLPVTTGVMLSVFGLIIAGQALRKGWRALGTGLNVQTPQLIRMTVVLGLIVGYIVLLPYLRFFVSTVLFTTVAVVYLGGAGPIKAIAIALITTAFIHGSFTYLFRIVMP